MTCEYSDIEFGDIIEEFNPVQELRQYNFKFVMMKYLFGCKTYQHSNLLVNKKNNVFVYKHLKELLNDVHNLFVKGGVRYIISDGTLLGAYRSGKFIEGDDDIDLRVDEYDWEKCTALLPYLSKKYKVVKVKDKNNFYRVSSRAKISGEPLTVDIASSLRPKEDKWPDWVNVDYLFEKPLNTIKINGLEVYCPNEEDILPYLEHTYGKEWNVKKCHNLNYKNYLILVNCVFLLIVGLFIYLTIKKSPYYVIGAVILFILVSMSLVNN